MGTSGPGLPRNRAGLEQAIAPKGLEGSESRSCQEFCVRGYIAPLSYRCSLRKAVRCSLWEAALVNFRISSWCSLREAAQVMGSSRINPQNTRHYPMRERWQSEKKKGARVAEVARLLRLLPPPEGPRPFPPGPLARGAKRGFSRMAASPIPASACRNLKGKPRRGLDKLRFAVYAFVKRLEGQR